MSGEGKERQAFPGPSQRTGAAERWLESFAGCLAIE
jgi:hypothetical protein